MFDELGTPVVSEAGGELVDHAGAPVDLTQEKDAAIGADIAALEIGLDFAATKVLKSEGLLDTVRHAAVGILCVRYCLNASTLHQNPNRPHFRGVRNAG